MHIRAYKTQIGQKKKMLTMFTIVFLAVYYAPAYIFRCEHQDFFHEPYFKLIQPCTQIFNLHPRYYVWKL